MATLPTSGAAITDSDKRSPRSLKRWRRVNDASCRAVVTRWIWDENYKSQSPIIPPLQPAGLGVQYLAAELRLWTTQPAGAPPINSAEIHSEAAASLLHTMTRCWSPECSTSSNPARRSALQLGSFDLATLAQTSECPEARAASWNAAPL